MAHVDGNVPELLAVDLLTPQDICSSPSSSSSITHGEATVAEPPQS